MGFANDLFQNHQLDCIPTISPGESLFSWCSRYHRIAGIGTPAVTSRRLFGSNTAGFVLDFPGRLGHFGEVTANLLGTPVDLIHQHTHYAFYAAFRPPETMAKVQAMMLSNSVERLKFVLGLPSSRAATSHPLKFCKSCANEEKDDHGIARWWLINQWPTTWICPKHKQGLHYVSNPNNQYTVASWPLPDDLGELPSVATSENLPDKTWDQLEQLGRLSEFAAKSQIQFRPEILRLAFYAQLQAAGWIHPNGTLRWSDIQNAFLNRYTYLVDYPGFDFILGIQREDLGILGPMLRGSKRLQHPSKYLLLIDLLFNSFEEFVEHYRQYSSEEDPVLTKFQMQRKNDDSLDKSLVELVIQRDMSLNKAALGLGITLKRVITWAERHKVPYQKRPHKESPEFTKRLLKLISKGASREEIAESLGVSRRWITAYMARNQKLRANWYKANLNQQIKSRRKELLALLEEHPGADQKSIRNIPGNPFQWLMRNDLKWLKQNYPFFGTRNSQCK